MTPEELTQIANQHGVDVVKLQVINDQGALLPHKRISEKAGIQRETSENLTAAGQTELLGGQDENGIPRSPADGQHRIEAAKLNAALSPVMQKIAGIQKVEEQEGVRAEFQRAELGNLLDEFKLVDDAFQVVDQAYRENRAGVYHAALQQEFTPVLQQQGFTAQEAAATVQALTKTAQEAEGNMANNPHFAAEYSRQLRNAYQQSSFDYSAFKPDANKVENAVCKAFNARMHKDVDGELKIRGQTPNFRARQAEQFSAEAAAQANLTLQPMKLPHQQMEPQGIYHVGGTLSTGQPQAGQGQQAQASETFKVIASGPMNSEGEQVAFAKRAIGARTADLHQGRRDEGAIMRSKMKDSEQIGTVAPLFGTSDAVGTADALDPDGKLARLGGAVSSLPARSVASSAVNEALGMKSVAKEAVGIDTDGRALGVSVVAPGAPMLKRPDENNPREAFLNVDYAHSDIQKGLYDLEAQDYITGQIDRHPGNIFIDPTSKQVTGIDNDLAFPTVDRNQMVAGNGGLAAKATQGMPHLMHSDTADRIEALRPEDLRHTLENLKIPGNMQGLEPAAIDGAVGRLQELQREIRNMRVEGRVVTQFTPEHFANAREAQIAKTEGEDLGSQGNYAAPRTSYVGSAVLLEARTAALNNPDREDYREYNKRTVTDPNTVAPPQVNPEIAAYKGAIDAVKADLAANPHKAPSPEIGGRIQQEKAAISALETQLTAQTQQMQQNTTALQQANQTLLGRNRAVAIATTALTQTQDQRQATLQQLAQAKLQLNATLDQAIEGQKPALHRTVGIATRTAELQAARQQAEVAQQTLQALGGGNNAMSGHRTNPARANLEAAQQKVQQAQDNLTQFDQQTAHARPPAVQAQLQAEVRPRANNNNNAAPSQSREDRLRAFTNASSSSSSDLSAEKPKAEQVGADPKSTKEKTGNVSRLAEKYEQMTKDKHATGQSVKKLGN